MHVNLFIFLLLYLSVYTFFLIYLFYLLSLTHIKLVVIKSNKKLRFLYLFPYLSSIMILVDFCFISFLVCSL